MPGAVKVAFDAQAFDMQVRGGISRYFSELVRALRSAPELGVQAELALSLTVNRHLQDAVGASTVLNRIPPRLQAGVISALDRRRRRRHGVDAVHHTYYEQEALLTWRGVPRVSTVHDMIPELFPELFPRGNPHLAKAEHVAASDLVICVSHATRRDLLAALPDCKARVEVVHPACAPEFGQPAPVPAWTPPEYLLYVGTRHGYKDWRLLLDALRLAAVQVPLVCVGGGPWTEEERRALAETGLQDRLVQRDVSDAELVGLYGGAVAFVFPSRYEGFGLPALEALAAGCPALLSDAPSLLEVADGAAAHFSRGDVEQLAQALLELLGSTERRQRLVRTGRLRARDFSWARTAARTAQLYRETLCR